MASSLADALARCGLVSAEDALAEGCRAAAWDRLLNECLEHVARLLPDEILKIERENPSSHPAMVLRDQARDAGMCDVMAGTDVRHLGGLQRRGDAPSDRRQLVFIDGELLRREHGDQSGFRKRTVFWERGPLPRAYFAVDGGYGFTFMDNLARHQGVAAHIRRFRERTEDALH